MAENNDNNKSKKLSRFEGVLLIILVLALGFIIYFDYFDSNQDDKATYMPGVTNTLIVSNITKQPVIVSNFYINKADEKMQEYQKQAIALMDKRQSRSLSLLKIFITLAIAAGAYGVWNQKRNREQLAEIKKFRDEAEGKLKEIKENATQSNTLLNDMKANVKKLEADGYGQKNVEKSDADKNDEYIKSLNIIEAIEGMLSITKYMHRANVYIDKGEYNNAIKDYNKVVAMEPTGIRGYYGRGLVWHIFAIKEENGKSIEYYKNAIEDYTSAIELKPNYVQAFANRGYSYFDLNDYKSAKENFEQALKINEKQADAYNGLATTYYKLDNIDEAIENFDKAVQFENKFNGKIKELEKEGVWWSDNQLKAMKEVYELWKEWKDEQDSKN